jgi:hypothetical protein
MNRKINLPDVLPAVRYRLTLNSEKVYVAITLWQDVPVEIFAEYPSDWLYNGKAGMCEAINMGISSQLRSGTDIDEVIRYAERSSVDDGDYSSLLAEILTELT